MEPRDRRAAIEALHASVMPKVQDAAAAAISTRGSAALGSMIVHMRGPSLDLPSSAARGSSGCRRAFWRCRNATAAGKRGRCIFAAINGQGCWRGVAFLEHYHLAAKGVPPNCNHRDSHVSP